MKQKLVVCRLSIPATHHRQSKYKIYHRAKMRSSASSKVQNYTALHFRANPFISHFVPLYISYYAIRTIGEVKASEDPNLTFSTMTMNKLDPRFNLSRSSFHFKLISLSYLSFSTTYFSLENFYRYCSVPLLLKWLWLYAVRIYYCPFLVGLNNICFSSTSNFPIPPNFQKTLLVPKRGAHREEYKVGDLSPE